MARISTYTVDNNINSGDKLLGSDILGLGTKNYTFQGIVDWFNATGGIAINQQNNYFFQTVAGDTGRLQGTVSFDSFGGAGTLFSAITQVKLAEKAVSGYTLEDYLPIIVGENIMFAQLDNLNNFGVYKVISITRDLVETTFFNVIVQFVEGHGALGLGRYYGISLTSVGVVQPIPTLQQVVDSGNTIQLSTTKTKGIDITLVDLATVYQNGISVTIPAQTGIYPTFQPAPDAYTAYLNGQNPGNLTGSPVGYVSDASGDDNIGFLSISQNNAGTSGGFNSHSFDAHTGYHFIARKTIATVQSPVFTVANNGDTTANKFIKTGGTNLQFLMADGSVTTGSGFVPYTGATTSVNLGTNDISARWGFLNELRLFDASYSTYGEISLQGESLFIKSSPTQVLANIDPGALGLLGYGPGGLLWQAKFTYTTLTANRTYALPNATGTIALTSDIPSSVTSVGLSMPSAFTVTNSPITGAGTIAVTGAGTASQYVRGDGTLATLPSGGGGGSSVNYYLNGSVNASVATYKQLSNTAIIGAGTNFTLVGNGLISQFLTDVGNPNRLEIPGGAWNFEMFFSMSSNGGTPAFYVELLKYNGATFTSIASNSTTPENITGGTSIDLYLTSLAVPTTPLLVTDRLAIRVYIVNNSGGRTATLHTEDSHLCEIITTFSGGVTSLNGLTANTQYFAVGTSGSDFNISSVTATHTFNLPTASATNRGALSSADWSTFNGKYNLPSLTSGSVLFSNGTTIAQDNANFFWDDANNRLGIGTITPTHGLNVYTTIADTGILLDSNTNPAFIIKRAGVERLKLSAAGAVGTINGLGNGLVFQTDSVERMRISSAGNVGIGTTAPTAKLHIAAPGALSTDIALRVRNSADSADLMLVNGLGNVGIGTASPNRLLTIASSASSIMSFNSSAYRNTTIGSDFYGNFVVYDDTAAAYRMVINSLGNVGIGTTTPSAKLEVLSTTFPVAKIIRSTNLTSALRSTFAAKHLTSGDMIDGFGPDISFIIEDNSNIENEIANFGAVRDGLDNNGALIFATRQSGSRYDRMKLFSDGRLALATDFAGVTSSPQYKLYANGSQYLQNINQQLFLDNFNRATVSPGGTPSITYNLGSSAGSTATILSNQLRIPNNSTAASGYTFVTGTTPISYNGDDVYNTTLEKNIGLLTWSFNFRTGRSTTLDGFGAGQFGVATILCTDAIDPQKSPSAGYAVYYINNLVYLVYFSNTLNVYYQIAILSPGGAAQDYYSARVTYDCGAAKWNLEVRDDGASAFSDPATGVYNLQSGFVPNPVTPSPTPMPYFGWLWNFGTTSTVQSAFFDNFNFSILTGGSLVLDGNIGIGINTPSTSAKLHLESTTQGFLPPRMTNAQRTAIAAPVGLMVYCTDAPEGLYIYKSIGWTYIG